MVGVLVSLFVIVGLERENNIKNLSLKKDGRWYPINGSMIENTYYGSQFYEDIKHVIDKIEKDGKGLKLVFMRGFVANTLGLENNKLILAHYDWNSYALSVRLEKDMSRVSSTNCSSAYNRKRVWMDKESKLALLVKAYKSSRFINKERIQPDGVYVVVRGVEGEYFKTKVNRRDGPYPCMKQLGDRVGSFIILRAV